MFLWFPLLLRTVVCDYLKEAKLYITQGKYSEALESYDKAIEADPNNHLPLFMRATCYLSMGKSSQAINDFTAVLNIKKDHHSARLNRAKLFVKDGTFESALEDLNLLEVTQETTELKTQIEQAKGYLRDSSNDCSHWSSLLLISPMNLNWRLERAQCFEKLGNSEQAIGDYAKYVQLVPDSIQVYLTLAELHVKIGELDAAVAQTKECLRIDPDQKKCKATFKSLKKLQKAIVNVETQASKNRWRDVISTLNDGLAKDIQEKSPALMDKVNLWYCLGHSKLKKYQDAIASCSSILSRDENHFDALVARGDAYMGLEDYKEAMDDFQKAHSINQQDQHVIQSYQKAQKLLKRSGMKDYYKILGVSRDATPKEIKKAYRKKAQEWHPDKYSGPLSKEQVQQKMSDINAAYEVLSNQETREKYDNGEDPNDPHGGQSHPFQDGGHQFFHQGGFPFEGFQGGGFTFRFG